MRVVQATDFANAGPLTTNPLVAQNNNPKYGLLSLGCHAFLLESYSGLVTLVYQRWPFQGRVSLDIVEANAGGLLQCGAELGRYRFGLDAQG